MTLREKFIDGLRLLVEIKKVEGQLKNLKNNNVNKQITYL